MDNEIDISLLPLVDKPGLIFIGKSAIIGIKTTLKSIDAKREIKNIVKSKVKYVELSTDSQFYKIYVKSFPLNT